jgi:hypothetical protein
MNGRQEPIALARHGFDEAGILRVVLQRGAQLLQSGIQAPLEIDVGPFRPQRLAKLFSPDNLPILLEQHRQDAKGLFLELDPDALAAEARPSQVRLK